MPAHSTARVLADEDGQVSADAEHQRDLILIESMVRDGRSEWEIASALRERRGWTPELRPAGSVLRRLKAVIPR